MEKSVDNFYIDDVLEQHAKAVSKDKKNKGKKNKDKDVDDDIIGGKDMSKSDRKALLKLTGKISKESRVPENFNGLTIDI